MAAEEEEVKLSGQRAALALCSDALRWDAVIHQVLRSCTVHVALTQAELV